MDSRLVAEIRKLMDAKPTGELVSIWLENDRSQWSEETFEAIRQSLIGRGEAPPLQKLYVSPTANGRKSRRYVFTGLFILVNCLAVLAKYLLLHDPPAPELPGVLIAAALIGIIGGAPLDWLRALPAQLRSRRVALIAATALTALVLVGLGAAFAMDIVSGQFSWKVVVAALGGLPLVLQLLFVFVFLSAAPFCLIERRRWLKGRHNERHPSA